MAQSLPLENEIAGVFAKFPQLPDNVKEILVKISPFLCIIGVIFGALGLLAVLGIGAGATAIGLAAFGNMGLYWVSMAILAVMVLIEGLAISPLMKRQKKGWDYMYYIFLLSLVSGIVNLAGIGSLFSNLISLAFSFLLGGWLLFQIREKYV
ncbi:hypothetical protein [Runella limosa]|uniref:hypothetical protein n=1 Tax=Runella limosa TaxID=370978 RepID=UPI00041393DE|nr:hypothetical protein [Runella limosa]